MPGAEISVVKVVRDRDWRPVLLRAAARRRLAVLRRLSTDLAELQDTCQLRLARSSSAAITTAMIVDAEIPGLLARLSDDLAGSYRRVRDNTLLVALGRRPDPRLVLRTDVLVRRELTKRHTRKLPRGGYWDGIDLRRAPEVGQMIDAIAAILLEQVLEGFDGMHKALDSAISDVVGGCDGRHRRR